MNEVAEHNPGFWAELKRKKVAQGKLSKADPIFVLAPMADVTDAAFRRIIAKYSRMGQPATLDDSGKIIVPAGGPDVMWTEFVSADGLFLAPPEGRTKIMKDLLFTEAERPIVAQFFTSRPEMIERAAYLAAELGFDGIDINMGCPDKSIEKQCAGAALMKNPKLAQELVLAAKRGAQKYAEQSHAAILPVSVKTRIGYSKNELSTWLPALLETNPAVITIHARTRKEMSKVPARWEHIHEAVEIRNKMQGGESGGETGEDGRNRTLIFGNGDVTDLQDGARKVAETGADGIMLGRAIFGNPWLFDPTRFDPVQNISLVPLKEKLETLVEHTKLFEELLGGPDGVKSFAIMKKHYKAYVNGFAGAAELRAELMNTNTATEVEHIIKTYISSHF